jgi:hypothetical protein
LEEKSIRLEEKKNERKALDSLLADVVGLEGASTRLVELDRTIESEEASLRKTDTSFQSEILKWGCNGMLKEAYGALDKHIALAENEDRLPPPFDPRQVQTLLDKGECICGHHVEPGSQYAETLMSVIEKYSVSSELGKILDESKRLFAGTKAEISSGWELIKAKNESVINSRKQVQKLVNEKKDILEKLQGHDATQIKHFASVRKSLDPEIENLIQDVVRLEGERNVYLKIVEKQKKEFDKAYNKLSLKYQDIELKSS